MRISKKGVDFIKKWEQFRPDPYRCSAGVITIGYGHTRTANEFMQPISKATAEILLKQDINIFEMQLVPVLAGINLRQCQYDAIVSFVFNLGIGTFKKSNAYKEMKLDPDSKKIADSFISFRNAGGKYLRGLMRRRIQELNLYYSW